MASGSPLATTSSVPNIHLSTFSKVLLLVLDGVFLVDDVSEEKAGGSANWILLRSMVGWKRGIKE